MSAAALAEAGIRPTTIRFAVGDEDPHDLIAHFIAAARLMLDPIVPSFSSKFMPPADIDTLVGTCYVDAHRDYVQSKPAMNSMLDV